MGLLQIIVSISIPSSGVPQLLKISSFLGQIAVELKLGKTLITHKVLIANIPIEGILGMDFL
jgi:hypothetical protein